MHNSTSKLQIARPFDYYHNNSLKIVAYRGYDPTL